MDHPSRKVRARHDSLTAYLFIVPSLAVICVFGIFPVFFTLYVSLFKWRPGGKVAFLGLGNYAEIFGANVIPLLAVLASIAGFILAGLRRRRSRAGGFCLAAGLVVLVASLAALAFFLPALVAGGDKEIFDALRVTILYSIGTVPLQLVAGMLLAVALTRRIRGQQAFRVVYLLPYISPAVASAAVFELLFSLRPDSFANQLLLLFGGKPLQWLQEPKGIIPLLFGSIPRAAGAGVVPSYWLQWAQGPSLALVSIIFYSLWVFIGYYALIYLNGLSAIPRQLYEAAEVDGAGRIRSFFSITIPLLSPTTYFLTLLGVIGTFKAFTHIYVLRHPAASGTVDPLSVSIFFTFFRKARLGYASAMSILLFAIVVGLTILQQRTLQKGVSYGD
jgi:multiple sugar transport system permease protein